LYGVAPAITSALSEYDAAALVGCPETDYCVGAALRTAVSKGHDFVFTGKRYQVKGNRPSGKAGSPVTLVSKAKNFEWDFLVWVLYDTQYNVVEAWQWEVADYRKRFEFEKRLSPAHMRQGTRLYPVAPNKAP
jgi:hypothetical protein